MNDSASGNAADRVECPADKDPAVRLFIATAMAVALSIWCIIDGYIKGKYPLPEAGDPDYMNNMATHIFNHYTPFVLLPVAIILIVLAVRVLRRFITADGEGLTINGKRHAWSDFTGVDASRLEKKGILVLLGPDDLRVELDRYKYKNFKPLVALVEKHVATDAPPAARTLNPNR